MIKELFEKYNIDIKGYHEVSNQQLLNKRDVHILDRYDSAIVEYTVAEVKKEYLVKNSTFKDTSIKLKSSKAVFINCLFDDVKIADAVLDHAVFINCNFRETIIERTSLKDSKFIYCQFERTMMRSTKISNSQWHESDLDSIDIIQDKKDPDYCETEFMKQTCDETDSEKSTWQNCQVVSEEENKGDINMDNKENTIHTKENTSNQVCYIKDETFDSIVDFTNKTFLSCKFKEIEISAKLDAKNDFANCVFDSVRLGVQALKCCFKNCVFKNCTFASNFVRCIFLDCVFDHCSYERTEFNDCLLSNLQSNDTLIDQIENNGVNTLYSLDGKEKSTNNNNVDDDVYSIIKPVIDALNASKKKVTEAESKRTSEADVINYMSSLSAEDKIKLISASPAPKKLSESVSEEEPLQDADTEDLESDFGMKDVVEEDYNENEI